LIDKRNKTCGGGMKYYSGDEMRGLGFDIKGIVLDRPGVTTRMINNF
jgi:hypothetical protein